MDNDDHIELLNTIRTSKAKIMLSGYDSKLYNDILADWNRKEFRSNDQLGRSRTEVVWMNYEVDEQLTISLD